MTATDHGSTPTTAERVISFDLDGTLINGPFARVLTDLSEELARRHQADGVKREIIRRHERLLGTDLLAAYDWQSIVSDYLDELGLVAPFDLLERLDQYAVEGATTILHDGTADLLGALRSAGWRVLVLTNGWRRYQEPVLRRSGLLAAIDGIVTSDDVGEAKPAESIFAAARAGATDYVHVGDRIDHDVIGGNAAGARTVLLRPDIPADPAELPAYLARLATAQGVPNPDPSLASPDLVTSSLSDLVDRLTHPSPADLSELSSPLGQLSSDNSAPGAR
ncbi:HAD family hydrolase [Microlunatus speluncae]|uniref:HAD family hydrolase n=1 Tax=Microlunatus speluncae TaxID=2594267 RepID=UPI0013763E83|nr:HAD family hydrolase [Microlunatus speluncae]